MKSSRLEWKVGLFLFIGLVLLGVLLLQFSKGNPFFTSTYQLNLLTANVGAIKPHAAVLMAGIQVGAVDGADLNQDGRSVTIRVKIFKRYNMIRRNAQFVIDQAGFLGDQYVSIIPRPDPAPLLVGGEVVRCEEPFNLQDAARTSVELMKRLDGTVQLLNEAVQRVDRILLAEQNLVNITNTVTNLRKLSDQAAGTVDAVDRLLATNSSPVSLSISNMAAFSGQLNRLSLEVGDMLATNRPGIATTMKNLESASGQVDTLLKGLNDGNGLAGALLKDEQLNGKFHLLVSNLTTVSSNLTRFGLLYKPKPVKTNHGVREIIYPGRNPFR